MACTRELSRSWSERPRPQPAAATTTTGRRKKRPAVRHRSAARAIGNGWLDIVQFPAGDTIAGSAQSDYAGKTYAVLARMEDLRGNVRSLPEHPDPIAVGYRPQAFLNVAAPRGRGVLQLVLPLLARQRRRTDKRGSASSALFPQPSSATRTRRSRAVTLKAVTR